jgi:hypothetical protein
MLRQLDVHHIRAKEIDWIFDIEKRKWYISIFRGVNMDGYRKSPIEFSVEDLDRELIARGAQVPDEKKFNFKDAEGTPERDTVMTRAKELYETPPPPDENLAHISTLDLAKILVFKTRSTLDFTRGFWSEELMDWNEIADEQIKKNAECAAAFCMKESLTDTNNGFSILKVKNYGKTFNLCDLEPFRDQPIASGRMCTGFLVKEDVIATAGHCVNSGDVTDLRFIFGFRMEDPTTPVIRISNDNIYKGVKLIHKAYDRKCGSDWALVKPDRSVLGQTVSKLSKDNVYPGQAIYVIGHPCGLPLKYGARVSVRDNPHESHFAVNLKIYMGSSGSPVFDLHTHEVVGFVVRGAERDFRWMGNGWMSVEFPEGKEAGCMKVSGLLKFI